MEILKTQNISKIYGSSRKGSKQYTAIKNISFTVNEGEFIGIMGASGSGKTTLLNILGSIDRATTGRLFIAGQDISSLKQKQLARHRMENIGFIFQDYNLLETMTIKENIILPLALSGRRAEIMEKEAARLADDLGITSILDKYSYEVSGGEQQRAAACRALISNPKIILADEPTGNLDSKSGRDLLQLLAFINQEHRATIIMVTHDAFAASYCRRILFIRDGDIYNQLHAGESKKEFFDSIIDVMSVLGGEEK